MATKAPFPTTLSGRALCSDLKQKDGGYFSPFRYRKIKVIKVWPKSSLRK